MSNVNFGVRMVEIGKKFSDRIGVGLLDGALLYVDHNEEHLAMDTLCDHLVEFEIRIQRAEYIELRKLIADMGLDLNAPPYRYLSELIVNEW